MQMIVLVAKEANELKKILKSFSKFLKKGELILNVEKIEDNDL